MLMRIAAVLAVLFVAYVAGRAVGILLDVNPYVTEAVAVGLALAAAAWTTARGRRVRTARR